MAKPQVASFYSWLQLAHPKAAARATHLTKFGGPGEVRRLGGPGTRRKNPRLYDSRKKSADS